MHFRKAMINPAKLTLMIVVALCLVSGTGQPSAWRCVRILQQAGFVLVSTRVPPEAALSPHAGFRVQNQPIRVDVTMVSVPLIATDKDGNHVTDLKLSECHIFEDGVQQKLDRLITTIEPFSVVLMLDRSGSTQFRLGDIQSAALSFVEALRPQDRLMIIAFDDQIQFLSQFAGDRLSHRKAIVEMQRSEHTTALYEALERVLMECLSDVPGRKAIVLFTDGVDNASIGSSDDATLRKIEKSDVIVYAVQYDTRTDRVSDRFRVPLPSGYESFERMYARAVKYLGNLSGRSGGRVYQAETIPSLKEAFQQIAGEIAQQYSLCYYPSRQVRDGSYRRIRVSVDRPGVKVRAKPGYRAAEKQPESR